MSKSTRYLGLDVHAETIAAAIAEGRKKVRSLGQLPNRPEAVRKLIDKLGGPAGLKVCYEAGPTGYALYWQLTQLGVECEVVAPSLIPKKAGERIKTDRRDAEKLAQCYQAGTLTGVWVPDAAHEALRDLVRARAAAKKDESRAKHRLTKYLLRYGLRHPDNCRAWTHPWWRWVQDLEFEHECQRAGVVGHAWHPSLLDAQPRAGARGAQRVLPWASARGNGRHIRSGLLLIGGRFRSRNEATSK